MLYAQCVSFFFIHNLIIRVIIREGISPTIFAVSLFCIDSVHNLHWYNENNHQ